MKYIEPRRAVLLLSDGSFFEGTSIGFRGTTSGELCFNTGMTGYQEIFTDPSYAGQVMVTTHTHIGNYGVHQQEAESEKVQIEGLIVKSFSWNHSRLDAESNLQDYLVANEIVGISDLDTRALVSHIRNKGAMNGIISSEIFDKATLERLELSSTVSTKEPYFVGNPDAKYKVSALDLGIKRSILRCMTDRDCYVKVFPHNATAAEMGEWGPNGYFLSNGPGDPAVMPYAVEAVSELLAQDKVIFGICLGHQMLCRAMGLETFKMHHGHRGINHPVHNLPLNKGEITSQNHGFAVSLEDAENHAGVEVTHKNLNDNTLEGIRIKGKRAFSVQYHPEASPGPHDSRYLFDDFVGLMTGKMVTV
ncbi:UNVERIFIED_CONTAM: hypothetical protein GTU68_029177 [Idotea baltica]|nr:hypothetical protein [Idotea baltica]